MRKLFYITISLLAVAACKKEQGKVYYSYPGERYFPVYQGLERIYEVDSIAYSSTKATPDSFHYQVREVLTDSVTDLTGEMARRVQRYTRKSDTAAWVISDVYEIKRNGSEAQTWRANLRLLKIVYPMNELTVFNTNKYNSQAATQTKYPSMNQSWNNEWLSFDSTLSVRVTNDSDFITRKIVEERYATGIGLIFGRYTDVRKVSLVPERSEGTHYIYRLRSYTK